jgi:hypothetical protein
MQCSCMSGVHPASVVGIDASTASLLGRSLTASLPTAEIAAPPISALIHCCQLKLPWLQQVRLRALQRQNVGVRACIPMIVRLCHAVDIQVMAGVTSQSVAVEHWSTRTGLAQHGLGRLCECQAVHVARCMMFARPSRGCTPQHTVTVVAQLSAALGAVQAGRNLNRWQTVAALQDC